MSRKIGTGIWFIFFGIVILLHNFDVIKFNFYAMLDYWPLVIIAIGINLLLQNKEKGPLISAVVNLGMCFFLLYIGITSQSNLQGDLLSRFNYPKDSLDFQDSIIIPYTDNQQASLTFDIGAASLLLDSISSNDLLRASATDGSAGLKLEQENVDGQKKIEIVGSGIKNNSKNTIHLSLNQNPVWTLEFNLGAATFVGDLRNHKFSFLEINSGAATLTLHLGMPQQGTSVVEINTAASTCTIDIPQDAACMIEHESIMSSKKMEGFVKSDDHYQTENYATATNKYILKINGAANSISINRIK